MSKTVVTIEIVEQRKLTFYDMTKEEIERRIQMDFPTELSDGDNCEYIPNSLCYEIIDFKVRE